MTDPFILTVNHKGRELDFTAQLVLQGYTHKFKVLVHNAELYFEPDEEGSYRAVKIPGQEDELPASVDQDLLSAIQQKITGILA